MNKSTSVPVALSLGGNIGDVPRTFAQALRQLAAGGLSSLQCSSLYRNHAIGCAPGTPDFINAAIIGDWPGSVYELKTLCQEIEINLGRPREHEPCASRTIDLDIILFGELILDEPDLKIPHPAASARAFVLVPLAEIAPTWNFPGKGRSIEKLLVECFGMDYPSLTAISDFR